jgi:hypothetical protein
MTLYLDPQQDDPEVPGLTPEQSDRLYRATLRAARRRDLALFLWGIVVGVAAALLLVLSAGPRLGWLTLPGGW